MNWFGITFTVFHFVIELAITGNSVLLVMSTKGIVQISP